MTETIGVIGAGRMGLPLIGHLARKGFRTFAGSAIGPSACQPKDRASIAKSGAGSSIS